MTQMMDPGILDPDNDDDVDVGPDINDPDQDTGDFEDRVNTGRVIVAIPAATEPIHHMGDVSEPKHLTMVWLGSPDENPDLDMDQVHSAVADIADQAGGPLTGMVSGTGSLGDQDAHVVFLHGDDIHQCHDDLTSHPTIAPAVDAVDQHPGWTPHTTLGYGEPDPNADYDATALGQVVFDRLGVWDGDTHTEYPLGPSASTEENTEPVDQTDEPDQPSGDEILYDNDEFQAALIEAMTKPIVIKSSEDMVAAITQCSGACGTAQLATRPILMKRARELGYQHLIPRDWLRQAAQAAAQTVQTSPDVSDADVSDLFARKTQLSAIPDTALRAAYMRGVREYAMTAPQSRPPLPRDVVAQARVNSLIRLAQGDLSARTDDRDLLP